MSPSAFVSPACLRPRSRDPPHFSSARPSALPCPSSSSRVSRRPRGPRQPPLPAIAPPCSALHDGGEDVYDNDDDDDDTSTTTTTTAAANENSNGSAEQSSSMRSSSDGTAASSPSPAPPSPGRPLSDAGAGFDGGGGVVEDDNDRGSDPAASPAGFILWGPPGSGKTSLCEALNQTHGLVHISTGSLLRAHVLYETDWGKKARSYVVTTSPAPDEIVIPMVLERLQQPDVSNRGGYLLDGFPRNAAQHAALLAAGFRTTVAIMLHAPRDTLSRRIRHRRLDPETDVLYNLNLRPPVSQEVLERLIVLAKDSAANVAQLFKSYGRATADTFDLLLKQTKYPPRSVDADRDFDVVLQDVAEILTAHGVYPLRAYTATASNSSNSSSSTKDASKSPYGNNNGNNQVVVLPPPPPRTKPRVVTPPDAYGRPNAASDDDEGEDGSDSSGVQNDGANANGNSNSSDDNNGNSSTSRSGGNPQQSRKPMSEAAALRVRRDGLYRPPGDSDASIGNGTLIGNGSSSDASSGNSGTTISSSSATSSPASFGGTDGASVAVDADGGPKSRITLIRCDGYVCERESVEESQIAFRGAATEQVMLVWNGRPRTVLLLVKKGPELMASVLEAARYLTEEEGLKVVVESRVQTQALANGMFLDTFSSPDTLHQVVDLVVCLGGDGLILHTSSLFRTAVPPVMSFNLGSLGFLTPFAFEHFRAEIRAVLQGHCNLSLRMRLACEIIRDGQLKGAFPVLNEVVVDRGASPYLSNLDCFCDGKYITTVQADGIIMSTPTGSTAYSMSAGGSMVHPSVPAILFTPICPHSLSFRPIVFPDSAHLRIQISDESRSFAWASFDGKSRQQLRQGDGLVVSMNLFPVPTVNKTDHTGDWFQSLDRAFNFNSRAGQKPLIKKARPFAPANRTEDDDDDDDDHQEGGNGKEVNTAASPAANTSSSASAATSTQSTSPAPAAPTEQQSSSSSMGGDTH